MNTKVIPCQHPPSRYWTWFAYDMVAERDILCVCCCDCGKVLAGAAPDRCGALDQVTLGGILSS